MRQRASTHFQRRCHSQSPQKWERGNERRRSLCDGGGRAVCLARHKKVPRDLKMSQMSAPQNPQIQRTDRRQCWGGRGDEPMRAKRRGRTTRAMSPSTWRQWLCGLLEMHEPKQSFHPVHMRIRAIFQIQESIVRINCKDTDIRGGRFGENDDFNE